jgi:DNA-binding response OmpR family regulator
MPKRILVCEDEPSIAHIIEVNLENMGHCVDCALTADQAVELFKASVALGKPYDLVITDVDMPGHTGLYFASFIRTQGYQGRIAVLTNLNYSTISHSVAQVQGEYYLKTSEITNLGAVVEGAEPERKRRMGD